MATMIYNCKRCKVGRRVEYPISYGPLSRFARRTYWRKDESLPVGRQQIAMGVWIESRGGGKPTIYGGDPLGVCPVCGEKMSFGTLVARTLAEVPCDARCTGARGHSCDCSCGGKNHGIAWAA